MTQARGKGAPGAGQAHAPRSSGDRDAGRLLPAQRRAAEVLRRLRALQEKVRAPRDRGEG